MGFKPFKWIKKHPLETAAIVALAGTGLGAAGIGPMAGLFATEGAGAGAAAGMAGGTLGSEFGGMTAAQLAASGIGGSSLLAPIAGTMAGEAGANSLLSPLTDVVGSDWSAGIPSAMNSNVAKGWSLTPKDAMLLGQMTGMGQQQPGQQPHFGGPVDMSNPYQRPAMATQDAITKKWLLQNDPATYARLYGQVPQGVV